MKKGLLFFVLLLTFGLAYSPAQAQSNERNCQADQVLKQQLKENPGMAAKLEALEKHIEKFVSSAKGGGNKPGGGGTGGGGVTNFPLNGVVTIPVVVHVVYRTSAENISDAQVISQINILNEDFRKTNNDANQVPAIFSALAGDSEIQFCLASRAPDGSATNGITRKQTTKTSFGTRDVVKNPSRGGVAPWDASKYLNIWVCNIGGGILGYAQFPGGSASTDGVVLDYRYTGDIGTATAPYGLGRTATHEVGHWLNLRHIWGDATCGNDFVADTPVHNTSNGGCPAYPHLSTCAGSPVEMTMNYMDYTYDECMYMFSKDQILRMRAVLSPGAPRNSLLGSDGCAAPSSGAILKQNDTYQTNGVAIFPNPATDEITVSLPYEQSDAKVSILHLNGQVLAAYNVLAGENRVQIPVYNLQAGMYMIRIERGSTVSMHKVTIAK